jgi:hypothetical protein
MRLTRPLLVVAWSVAGLLIGHQLAYALVFRDPAILAHALADTGHHWLTLLPIFLAAATAVGVAALWAGGRGPQSQRHRLLLFGALQLSAYSAIEVAERLAHGAGLEGIAAELRHPGGAALLLVGLLLQALIAVGLALLSRAAEAVVARLRRRTPAPTGSGTVRRPRPDALLPLLSILGPAHAVRAPPLRG